MKSRLYTEKDLKRAFDKLKSRGGPEGFQQPDPVRYPYLFVGKVRKPRLTKKRY